MYFKGNRIYRVQMMLSFPDRANSVGILVFSQLLRIVDSSGPLPGVFQALVFLTVDLPSAFLPIAFLSLDFSTFFVLEIVEHFLLLLLSHSSN